MNLARYMRVSFLLQRRNGVCHVSGECVRSFQFYVKQHFAPSEAPPSVPLRASKHGQNAPECRMPQGSHKANRHNGSAI